MKKMLPLLLLIFCLTSLSDSSWAWRRIPYCAVDCPDTVIPPPGHAFEIVPGDPAAMHLVVNLDLAGPGAGTLQDQFDTVQAAINEWNNNAEAQFNFTVEPCNPLIGNCVGGAPDGINSVVGTDLAIICGNGVYGFSASYPPVIQVGGSIEIIEKDLVICDNNFDWFASGFGSANPDGAEMDLLSAMLHELGHHFGLGHPNFNGNPADCIGVADTGAAMDTCVLNTGFTRRSLNADDMAGIQAIYGQLPLSIIDQLGTTGHDYALAVSTDSHNNVYVAGWTQGDLDGNISAGDDDLFLSKYNSSGVRQWTRQLGSTSDDYAEGVAVDSNDNIYVTGRTYGGLGENVNVGGTDLFLVKYDSFGVRQWTQQLGTSGNDNAYGLAVDSNDDIYVTGTTNGDLDGNISAGGADLFLVKYDSSGVRQWTQQLGSTEIDRAYGVTVDSNDDIYVTGHTNGDLDGNINVGSYDLFITKYNSTGVTQWTQQLGTTQNDFAYGPAVDSNDDIYVTGHTNGDLDGNPNVGGTDLFLVKYDSNGAQQWTQQLGSTTNDQAWANSVDSHDNIYVTGYTAGDLDGNISAGLVDLFLVKYDSTGVKQWTQQIGSTEEDRAYGIAIDSYDNIYMAGNTEGDLGGNFNIGGYDLLLVKYGDNSGEDTDGDGIPNNIDNCPSVYNPSQTNLDGDDLGDDCDTDADGDGAPNDTDNCPKNPNPTQEDLDGDGLGNLCDQDRDGDGVPNDTDTCPEVPNPGKKQVDTDGDGIGDACE